MPNFWDEATKVTRAKPNKPTEEGSVFTNLTFLNSLLNLHPPN